MSYEPTNWKTGDVVTSAKLNKLENGVAQSGGDIDWFVINILPGETLTIDKTWQEIKDAYASGKIIVLNLGSQIITQYDPLDHSGELVNITFNIPNILIENEGGTRMTVELWSLVINDTGVNDFTKSIMVYSDSQ